MQIKQIALTSLGTSKFNKWLSAVGKPDLNLQAVSFEALSAFEDAINDNQTPTYELGQQFTTTGRPEVFTLESEDFTAEITHEED